MTPPQSRSETKRNGARLYRVVVIDAHAIVGEGIRSLTSKANDLEVVGDFRTAAEGVDYISERPVDVAVIDDHLEHGDGVDACEMIRALDDPVHVLIYASYLDDEIVAGALRAGATGLIGKWNDSPTVIDAIRRVAVGQTVIDPRIAGTLVTWACQPNSPLNTPQLSSRERDVLRLVAGGRSNKQVAFELGISQHTVKTHIEHAFAKLGCSNRTEAVAIAQRRRLL